MKKNYIALLFSLVFTGNALAGIVFEKPIVIAPCEAGQAVITAELPFKISGDNALSVTEIKTGCDCTVAVADAPEYAAGSTGKIKITFTAGERLGLQRKTISVKTSDGGEAVAFFQTTIPKILEIAPAFVFWRSGDAPAAKEIAITVVSEKQLQVTGIALPEESGFVAELKTVEPGKRYTLRITPVTTDAPKTERIVLKTDFSKDNAERFVVVAAIK